MRKLSKTLLSLLLIAAMLASFVVLPAAAEEPAAEQPTEAVQAAETQSTAAVEGFDLSIVMLDCGRKYFSVDSIKQIIDNASAAGFGYIMLGVGNDGMRFLLDDMSLTVNGTTYESDAVKSAIHAGNEAYYNFDVDELTQSEMDAVLAYAKEKGMGVIPMLNTPGHMDAILAAATSLTGTNCAYSVSARTIDVTNSTAVAFTQAFVQKYVDYFASKGCKYFNMGADEYANDVFTSGPMGFGNLQSAGKYSYYVTYVNDVAAMIKNADMTPMAFNDGIYFNNNTSSGTFDTDIVICYWSNGWSGYTPMPASDLASKGFKMVNTNGSYYWVLGKSDAQCSASKAKDFDIKSFPGSTIDNPSGAMFCIWADYPGADSESNVISSTAATIAAFGKTLPEVKTQEPDATVTKGNISITAPGLTDAMVTSATVSEELDGKKVAGAWNIELTTANGSYSGSATVKVPLDGKWTGCTITAGVVNEKGDIDYGTVLGIENGFLTFTAPHFSTVVVLAEPQQKSLVVPTNGTKTVEENGDLTAAEVRYSAEGIVSLESRTFANNVTTMTFKGLANGDVSVTVGNLVYQITVTDKSYTDEKTIKVSVGGTETVTVDGEVSSTYTDDFVSVKTETQDILGDPSYEKSELSAGTFYVSTSYNASSPTVKITLEDAGDGEHYYVKNAAGEYVYPDAEFSWWNGRWSYSLSSGKEQVTITTNSNNNRSHGIRVSRTVTNSTYGTYTTTAYLQISGSSLSATQTGTWIYLYKATYPVTGHNTVITFSGKQVGRTQVVIGDVLYTIVVEEKVPDGAMTNTSLTLEYWITNGMVYRSSSKTGHTDTITTDTAGATSEDGVDITEVAPNQAFGFFSPNDAVTVYYWQSVRLDKDNKQTNASGDDETADGTTFTHVRYHAGAWQYKTLDGTWHYFLSTDQAVAYYLQKTEVTTEVDTYVKDWGYTTENTTDDTSDGKGQVALTIAVVYPDGTVSPAENDMYANSTTIFNYWDGRDIGIVAPRNNSDYTISKITVTDGNRKSNSTANVWYASDTITWEKVTTDAGTEWYDETTVWDEVTNAGTTPMVNGKNSNITWSAKNTAKLVLIYLKPTEKETNLKVVYYDDTYSQVITDYDIAMKYVAGDAMPSFLTALWNNDKDVHTGVFELDNDAYVTNSSGVHQTFNKDVSTVSGVASQYKSGFYKYVQADISADGKTMTLHFAVDETKLKSMYVIDFGLPVRIPISSFGMENPQDVTAVTVLDSELSYGTASAVHENDGWYIVYVPNKTLKAVETLRAEFTYSGHNAARLTIGLIPASTVYYEEGFATYDGTWNGTTNKGTGTQTLTKLGDGKNTENGYGYDDAYKNDSTNSNATTAVTTTVGSSATFQFKGTGLELYLRTENTNSTSDPTSDAANSVDGHSYMLVQVYEGNDPTNTSSLKRMSFVDVNNLFAQPNRAGYGYNTPCWTVDGMADGEYTVVVRFVKGETLAIDGFRVTNKAYESSYAQDNEAQMKTSEIRNMVLKQADVDNTLFTKTDPMYRVGENEVLDAVFDKEDASRIISGAVVIRRNYTDESNAGALVDVTEELVNIGPKNEIYLNPGEAVVMELPTTYTTVQVGMRSLTGDTVTYKINSEPTKEMKSTVDMYYRVALADGGKLVIQNKSDSKQILALTKLKVTGAGTTTNDVSVETTPEAIRYAMALMRGIDVPQFTDVAEDAWYHDYVYDLVYRGVVNGMTATTYEPEGKLTRAQFVKLLACSLADAETLKTYEGQHPFKDSEGHWAEAYIAWAKDKGIVEGVSATEFDPEAPITREQMATIFGRYALKQGIELPKSENAAGSFPDADKISEYAREFVELMRIAGILNGYEDGTFRPQGNATRAEAAKLFSLFLSITDKLAK